MNSSKIGSYHFDWMKALIGKQQWWTKYRQHLQHYKHLHLAYNVNCSCNQCERWPQRREKGAGLEQKNDLYGRKCSATSLTHNIPYLLVSFSTTWCVTFLFCVLTSSWGRFIQRKDLTVAVRAQHTTQNTPLYQSLGHYHWSKDASKPQTQ